MRLIITGAASGVGRAVATLAAERYVTEGGAQLLLVDRDKEKLERVSKEIEQKKATAIPFVAELENADAPARAVEKAAHAFGGLDAIVSNAAISSECKLKDLPLAEFDRTIAINTRPTLLFGQAAYPLLKESRGSIVATASISGDHVTSPLGAYSASKAALIMLVKQMAHEWGPDGIRCNCVSPGTVLTGFNTHLYSKQENRDRRSAKLPLRRLGMAEDIANMILFLIGPQASYITGVNILVDGGMHTTLFSSLGNVAVTS